MSFITKRIVEAVPRLVGRKPEVYGQELQEFLDKLLNKVVGGIPTGFGATAAEIESTPVGDVSATNVQDAIAELDSEKVPKTRIVATQTPLGGGGTLAADLTLTVATMTGDSGAGGARGVVPAPAAGDAAAGKYLKASGAWDIPPGGGGGGGSPNLDGGLPSSTYGAVSPIDGGAP